MERFIYLYSFLFYLITNTLQAQTSAPIITNYDPQEYTQFVNTIPYLDNATKQGVKSMLAAGWASTQANNGKLYFGTTAGVLEFDGQNWDVIFLVKSPSDDPIAARSIRFDKNTNKVYVGGQNEFGYLEKLKNGKMGYVSLHQKFKDKIEKVLTKNFGEIWSIQVYKNEIYFHTRFGTVIYNGQDIRIIPTNDSYHRLFTANQNMYIRQDKIGLCKFEKDNIVPLKFGEMFAPAPNFQISGLIPHYKGGILLGTRREGLFMYGEYGETKEEAFNKNGIALELDAQLKEAQIYYISQLSDGNIAVATLRSGLFILDRDLNLLYHLNEANGLQANGVLSIFQDKDNYIWLTTFKGIAKIALNTPLAHWSAKQNANLQFNQINEYQGELYATCNIGLFKLNKKNNAFQPIQGIASQTFGISTIEIDGKERLFIFADNLYELIDEKAVPLLTLQGRNVLTGVNTFPNEPNILYYYSNNEKITKVVYTNGKARVLETINTPINPNIGYGFMADREGNIWFANPQDEKEDILQVYSLKKQKIIHAFNKKSFKNLHQINKNERAKINLTIDFEHKLIFCINGQIYVHDNKTNTFTENIDYTKYFGLPDSTVFDFFGNVEKKNLLFATTKDNIWHLFLTPNGKNKYKIDSIPNKFFFENGYNLRYYNNEKKQAWYAGQEDLYRYDLNIKEKYNVNFLSYIRTAQPIYNPNKLYIYDVFGSNTTPSWQLAYSQNALRFEFSAVDFSSKEKIKFRYFLENNDTQWSDWSSETYKEYANLSEGTYTLHLQAINHYGFTGQTASFTFTILPPWYRTWWAYGLYVLIAAIVVYVLVYLNMRRLRKQNEYLANLVKVRTQEIEEQRDEILAQSEELRQSNDEILAQKEEIETQRNIVEKQNHELIDSINYGSRIQAAMLPFKERINKTLPAYFILFQPRDVVSGDFYWFHDTHPGQKQVGKSVMAVADCTGHGVPGAFMSMIANQIMYEVIIKKQILEADVILHSLHLEVRRSLRQYETDNRDGMDIGLIIWDKEKETLEFAGAKNNLIYFCQNEMHVVKGDKKPIGGEQREEERFFTKNTIALYKTETNNHLEFYLYSDGYQDQFGGNGAETKKFSPQRFRNLLTEIHTKDMDTQEDILKQTIAVWRTEGRERQTDDILVWGVRL